MRLQIAAAVLLLAPMNAHASGWESPCLRTRGVEQVLHHALESGDPDWTDGDPECPPMLTLRDRAMLEGIEDPDAEALIRRYLDHHGGLAHFVYALAERRDFRTGEPRSRSSHHISDVRVDDLTTRLALRRSPFARELALEDPALLRNPVGPSLLRNTLSEEERRRLVAGYHVYNHQHGLNLEPPGPGYRPSIARIAEHMGYAVAPIDPTVRVRTVPRPAVLWPWITLLCIAVATLAAGAASRSAPSG